MPKPYSRYLSFFMKNIRYSLYTLIFSLTSIISFGQAGENNEVKKPAKYENRTLKSEKTGEKKFTLPRHVIQNTVTHYNYFFNANAKLNEVIAQAKASFKDDYSQLLPFYNYTLEGTSQNKTELDSIIYKCTAGILLHDLRNDWIDNLYLLLGKTYLLRNDLDSAGMTFQYLNFAFAPKEEGGYDIPIGSSSSNETGEFSIATKEKNRNTWSKITGHKPSRNESFIWQIRNHIEKNELPEASGIIEILRNDPNFPKRLFNDLHEMEAYWFYKQQLYDSAAFYLRKSIDEAGNKQEEARREFLIGQLYQLADKSDDAIEYYNRSIRHTNDPVMDVYARLNGIKAKGGNDEKFMEQNIAELVKMAHKDKYENYRDILYYAAATIELERNRPEAAQNFLLKSVEYTVNNPFQKSASFMLLGDLNYDRKDYPTASHFYDSTQENYLHKQADKDRLALRKTPLKMIADNDVIIHNEDSLQALAKLTPEERDLIIKKKVKQLRKAKGLKEEETSSGNPAIQPTGKDLFSDSKGGEFYFYNATQKARGFGEFKARWGQRPNVDNWRRLAAVNQSRTVTPGVVDDNNKVTPATTGGVGDEMSYDGLLNNVPLTPEKMQESNDKLMDALFTQGKTFLEKLEDYRSAIATFEELLRRFPNTAHKDEALFDLVYASEKVGEHDKAVQYKAQLLRNGAENKWVKLISDPNAGKPATGSNAATKKYEEIYNLFVEGRFEEAKTEKKAADSVYGNSYWTPQLLFIEAIYYVKQREDSTAIRILTTLATRYLQSPLSGRARTMLDVVKRRKEIEDYLTNLDVKKQEDVSTSPATSTNTNNNNVAVTPTPPGVNTGSRTDTTGTAIVTPSKPKAETVTRKDTTAAPATVTKTAFNFVPTDAHFVVLLLDKVDPVYATEARNAFNRYNREKYYNETIAINSLQLEDRFNLVLEGPFTDANAAVDYVEKTKPVTASRILPWLTADKYSFLVISSANLEILKASKDVNAYRQVLQQAFPGKF